MPQNLHTQRLHQARPRRRQRQAKKHACPKARNAHLQLGRVQVVHLLLALFLPPLLRSSQLGMVGAAACAHPLPACLPRPVWGLPHGPGHLTLAGLARERRRDAGVPKFIPTQPLLHMTTCCTGHVWVRQPPCALETRTTKNPAVALEPA